MALQPIYEKLKNDSFKKLAGGQSVVNTRVMADGGKIAKVLSISAKSQITGSEMLSGEGKVSGKVEFKILYVNMDGDIRCTTATQDFTEKLVARAIEPMTKATIESVVVDVDTASISQDEVRVSCVVELVLNAVLLENLECLKGGGEDLYIQSETVNAQELSGSVSGEITISEEFKCNKTAQKILFADCDAIITECRTETDAVFVKGSVAVHCAIEVEGGVPEAANKILPFEQELPAMNVVGGDVAHIQVRVQNSAITLQLDEDSASIQAEVMLAVSGDCFRESECEVVTDAFSVVNETKCTAESFEVTKTVFTKAFEEKIDGSASLEAEMPAVDKVFAALAPRVNIANAYPDNDRIVVEGVLNTGVVYYNAELNSLNSVQVELPYSITLNASGVKEDQKIVAKGIVTDAIARVRKISEVEVSAEVIFTVSVDGVNIGYAITSIECGAERTPSNSAIAIYITKKGENLWDVAKNLVTTPELILSQNPDLKVPLEGGERILIYHQLKAKF